MAKYANQKRITIKQKEVCDEKHIYAKTNKNAMLEAMKKLKPNSFKLWMYLSSNQQGFQLDLSQQAVQNDTGMKKDAYDGAVAELIEKGYLVLVDKKTIFDFIELPKEKKEEIAETPEIKKQEKPTFENGENPLLKMGKNHEKYNNNTTQDTTGVKIFDNSLRSLSNILIQDDSYNVGDVDKLPTISKSKIKEGQNLGLEIIYVKDDVVCIPNNNNKLFRVVEF